MQGRVDAVGAVGTSGWRGGEACVCVCVCVGFFDDEHDGAVSAVYGLRWWERVYLRFEVLGYREGSCVGAWGCEGRVGVMAGVSVNCRL